MKLTDEQLANLRAALASGVAAIAYILEPGEWPRFCAWAEAHTAQTWGPLDRPGFDRDMAILAAMGGLSNAPRHARQHPRS